MHTLKTGPGTPIVFLHGFLGNSFDWLPICSYLPPCHCIGIDLPGHGTSPFTAEFAIDLPRFHLVGYSMGARLALTIPKAKLASLTLLSVHPGLKTDIEKQKRLQTDLEWAQLLLSLPIDDFLKRWYDQPIFQNFTPDLKMRRKQNIPDLAKALLEFSLAKQTYQKLDGVLIGENDEKFKSLHENPILIEDAAHAIHLENPKAVAKQLHQRIFS